jgi:hypothetical protein
MRAALLLPLIACSSPKSDAVSFKRDYSKEATWTYAYKQSMKMTMPNGVRDLQSDGEMKLVSNKDKTATLTVVAKLSIDGAAPQQAPPMQVTLTEDGTGGKENDSSVALIGVLFPRPTKPMKIGDTDSTTITIPAKGLAGRSAVSAPMVLKYVGNTDRCAQLEGTLRIDETSGDEPVKVAIDGKYCLDRKDASLVTSSVAIDMQIGSKMGFGGTLTLDRTIGSNRARGW